MKKHLANAITSLRLILPPILFAFAPFSAPFWTIYLLCGVSDMIDGTVARRTGTSSALGEKLDTLADFVFLFCVFIKLVLDGLISTEILCATAVVFLIKTVGFALSYFREKTVNLMHTKLNKLSGLVLFFYPIVLPYSWSTYYAGLAVVLTSVSAFYELYLILKKPLDSPPRG